MNQPATLDLERIWLGWEGPVLRRAADALLDRAKPDDLGAADLSRWIVVTPGARAGRTLLSMLVEAAHQRRTPVLPPVFTTPGEIGIALLRPSGMPVGEFSGPLLWESALRSIEPHILSGLIRSAPDPEDGASWAAIGAMFSAHHRTLCGEMLLFHDVAARLDVDAMPEEADRWRIASLVQMRYLALVQESGLLDQPFALFESIRAGLHSQDKVPLVLVGVTELAHAPRSAIALGASPCLAFVTAPASYEDDFDHMGCLRTDRWLERDLQIDEDAIRIAEDPADAALAAFEAIAEWDSRFAPSEIVVGALEPSAPGALEREAALHENVRVRNAAGRSLATSQPVHLLNLLADLIAHRSYEALGAAIRQPDLARWITRWIHRRTGRRLGLSRILRVLDDHRCQTLLSSFDEGAHPDPLDLVLRALRVLLRHTGFARARDRKLTLAEASSLGADLLARIYASRRITPHTESGQVLSEACERVRDLAEQADILHASAIGAVRNRINISDAWHTIAGLIAQGAAPPPPDDSAIELLGWLELTLDPAPAVVVVGVNEGVLPSSRLADALLPDSLRSRLGITSDATRLGRDRFLLECIIRARNPDCTRLIVLKRDLDGSPMQPSRLLFRDDSQRIAHRLARITEEAPDRHRCTQLQRHLVAGARDLFAMPPRLDIWEPVRRMSVTSFGRYLRSPFAFYLERVLHLDEIDDRTTEFDAMSFGTLVHNVLERFGNSETRLETHPDHIDDALQSSLTELVHDQFGSSPRAPIQIQIESVRRRLEAFAKRQAERCEQGWRIQKAEWKPENGVIDFIVDALPMTVSGKIDRIDYNEQTGQWALLDYKTGSAARSAKSAHQTRDGYWRDLQLPLYRHLAAAIIGDAVPELGYISLSRDLDAIKFDPAGWEQADLDQADELARAVVRDVRACRFEDLGEAPPEDGVLGWLCAQGFLINDEVPA